jgi:hypothetical protein
MKSTKIILCFLACIGFAYRVDSQATTASKPIVIAASTVLDGRGGVLRRASPRSKARALPPTYPARRHREGAFPARGF